MTSASRRASGWLHRHPKARLGGLLTLPITWLVLAYLGSLAALFVTSLYSTDPFTSDIVKKVGTENFSELASKSVYRSIAVRTIGIAAAVTVIDVLLAVPMALFMAKVASPRARRLLVVAVLMPLWASYLVKGYSWRAILEPSTGVLKTTLGFSPGFGVLSTIIGLAYLWLPYMILPIQAGLDRLPNSLLEASSDLGGRTGVTIRKVVLPMLVPSIVAGTIFTFSLSLGDYITVQILGGKTQMIGNVVFANFGASNIPFAAAFALVPVVVMVAYLLGVRGTGAFENL
jgi:ABC-type spermidine/putrescine transport system permease subunit I